MKRAATPPPVAQPWVDLMPVRELRRRASMRVLRIWIRVAVAVIVLMAAAVGAAYFFRVSSEMELSRENAHTTLLMTQIGTLSEVSEVLSARAELEQLRASATSNNLDFSELLGALAAELPEGTAITGIEFVPGGVPAGDDARAEIGLAGLLRIESAVPGDVVQIVRGIRDIDWISVVDVTAVESPGAAYEYAVYFAADQTRYSGEGSR